MKKFILIPIYYALISIFVPFLTTLIPQLKTTPPPDPPPEDEKQITVFNHITQTGEEMNLEDYLIGVVSAEMPAAFESEALKAQAVAARTYTLYKSQNSSHAEDICTDPSHCQAYYSKRDMVSAWGKDYDFYFNKIKSAVHDTKGEYLTYNNEPAMAVFHSMGGGKTENSFDVWGTEIPYLVSVDSPGEEVATDYKSEVTLTFAEFGHIISTKHPLIHPSSYLDFSAPTLTEGGHVKSIIICGTTFSGTEIRNLLNLRSTKFDIKFHNDSITFSVTGYGHGVGMSQYGANAMAKDGKDYKAILSHYYQGITLNE